jgi:hypothetical protein
MSTSEANMTHSPTLHPKARCASWRADHLQVKPSHYSLQSCTPLLRGPVPESAFDT